MDRAVARAYGNTLASQHHTSGSSNDLAFHPTPNAAEETYRVSTNVPDYDPVEDINNIIATPTKSNPTGVFFRGEYTSVSVDTTRPSLPTTPPRTEPPPTYVILLRLAWFIFTRPFANAALTAKLCCLFGFLFWCQCVIQPAFRAWVARKFGLETTEEQPRNWAHRLHDYVFPEVEPWEDRYPTFVRFLIRLYNILEAIYEFLVAIYAMLPPAPFNELWQIAFAILFFFLACALLWPGIRDKAAAKEARESAAGAVSNADIEWSFDKRFDHQEPIRYDNYEAWAAAGTGYRRPTAESGRHCSFTVTEALTVTETVTDTLTAPHTMTEYITVAPLISDQPMVTVTETHSVTMTEYAHGDVGSQPWWNDLTNAQPVDRTPVDNSTFFCEVCRQMHCCDRH